MPQGQFKEHAAVQQRTDLFRGVAIMTDGFTTPSWNELRQLMALHGGEFHNYYHRDRGGLVSGQGLLHTWRGAACQPNVPPGAVCVPTLGCLCHPAVTHIICSNLPDAKVKQLQRERNPTPIVRPEWVVDCIKAGALLPVSCCCCCCCCCARACSTNAGGTPWLSPGVCLVSARSTWRVRLPSCAHPQLGDYSLYQLRDAPGQQKLKAFAQVPALLSPPTRPACLPASLPALPVSYLQLHQAGCNPALPLATCRRCGPRHYPPTRCMAASRGLWATRWCRRQARRPLGLRL